MAQRIVERLIRTKAFGKSPLGAFLHLGKWIWQRLPPWLTRSRPLAACGHLVHALVRLHSDRRQYLDTFFLRNRAELELIRRLAHLPGDRDGVRLAVLGCSNGAEVYSILWAIRSTPPAPKLIVNAVDISRGAVEVARQGLYRPGVSEFVDDSICTRMTEDEMGSMFERDGRQGRIKSWIREGIVWQVGDASDPQIVDALGSQDLVVANRFLCHMEPHEAERCLRNIARLVVPGGYLCVSGVDLDVRTKVAKDLGWKPVRELIEEVHDGDGLLRLDWPWSYWGLEPFDRSRDDWEVRYASVFQLGERS